MGGAWWAGAPDVVAVRPGLGFFVLQILGGTRSGKVAFGPAFSMPSASKLPSTLSYQVSR